jgi:hypothetical protein
MRFIADAGPGLLVEVDDSFNIVLVKQPMLAAPTRIDVSNVEALREALAAAKTMQAVLLEVIEGMRA